MLVRKWVANLLLLSLLPVKPFPFIITIESHVSKSETATNKKKLVFYIGETGAHCPWGWGVVL